MVLNRMKNFKLLSLIAALSAVFALASCEELGGGVGSEEISVSIKNPKVSSDSGSQFVSVKCSGDWTLALVQKTGEVDWASLSITSGSGNKSNVRLDYKTNSTLEDRELSIYLDNGAKSVFCTFVQTAGEYRPDDEPEDDPSAAPGNGSDPAKTGWLELPAMDDEALQYYSFSFSMNGKTYRNYSAGYSKKDYLALWVAYPLNPIYTKGSGGSSEWIENPLVDDQYEPNYSNSFGYSQGYERGHQIANADRKCSAEANQQTYYFTNATLQHKDFNGHIWAALESNLRSAASSDKDTVYVITGCVLSDSPKTITDRWNHKVPVPSGYFKAAVRYSESSTLGKWLGAAFYLEHKTYPYKAITSAETMTIDQLEEKLGMDFFVNLPAKIGAAQAAAVESQDPTKYPSVWNIN